MTTSYSWVSTELRTGRILAELPDLDVREVPARISGGVGSASGTTPLDRLPEWERALEPGGATLVLLEDGAPIWGGIVWGCADGPTSADVALATWESFGDRRFTGDLVRTGVARRDIAASLAGLLVDQTPLIIETTGGPGQIDSRSYADEQDKTVRSALTELSAAPGGPEWVITWRHLTSPERLVPVLTIADRIGSDPAPGYAPAAVFDYPGCVTTYRNTLDYSDGKGATSVVATSTASGDVRPQSPPQLAADPDRPRIEHRFTPATEIAATDTLTGHAQRAGAAMAGGQRDLELTSVVDPQPGKPAAPRLGRQWAIGDTVGYAIDRPYGTPLTGLARVVAWSLNLKGVRTMTPTLRLAGS